MMTETETRESFEGLLAEYGDRIFNSIHCILGNYHEAEDVFQETFSLAFSNISAFRGDSQPGTWLYRIAMNAVKSHIKKNRRHLRLAPESEPGVTTAPVLIESNNGTESRYFNMELSNRIRGALQALPVEFRGVFVLSCVDGYSYREISEMLGVPIGTVESRLFRARDQLRKELSDLK